MFIVHGMTNGQVWQNALFYQIVGLVGTLEEGQFTEVVEEFALRYLTDFIEPTAALFSTGMGYVGVRGENLFNPAAIGAYEYSPSPPGSDATTPLGQFVAYGWTTPSARRGMNSGQRRMPGVTEGGTSTFGAVEPAKLTIGAIAAAFWSQSLIISYDVGTKEVEMRPVIVQRVREGAGTPEDPYEYRLPRTIAERVTYPATAWVMRQYTTTQNSRKTGRGI